MNLFEAIVKINNRKKPTISDIRDIMSSVVKGNTIYIEGNRFFIECNELSCKIILNALYNDMCTNQTNYNDTDIFLIALQKIDVNLYRLQKISRV